MPITIDGSGTITGLSAGGLPDATIVTADIADANITAAKLNGAQSGSAPIYAARAWVNFNGTGTVAIRASGNVSSVTDSAAGDYTINLTVAMPDTDYAFFGFARRDNDTATSTQSVSANATFTKTTSSFRIKNNYIDNGGSVGLNDVAEINVVVFR